MKLLKTSTVVCLELPEYDFCKPTVLLSFSNSATHFHYMQEKAGISLADISYTEQFIPKNLDG